MSSLFNGSMGQSGVDTGDIPASLRFRGAASAYLSRTFGTPTSNTVWSFSCKVKRGALGSVQAIFTAGSGGLWFNASDQLSLVNNAGVSLVASVAVFRDPTSHYFIDLISNGTTVKAYVNNVEVLSYTGTVTNLNSAIAHNIGRHTAGANQYFDGYLSRVCFVDGQALTPSSFGYLNTEINEWVTKTASQVKAVVDAGGTNSFMLDFNDATSLTTLGNDYSSKNNDWTLNNFSLTAGTSYDRMLDVPGNSFVTLSPIATPGVSPAVSRVPTNANLYASSVDTGSNYSLFNSAPFPSTGKWYTEVTIHARDISVPSARYGLIRLGNSFIWWVYSAPNWQIYCDGSPVTIGQINAGDVIQLAVDMDARKVWFGNNGSWYLSGNPETGTAMSPPCTVSAGADVFVSFELRGSGAEQQVSLATGQAPLHASSVYRTDAGGYFRYTPPTGFKALCQRNMPDPAILNPEKHFDVKLHTGNAAPQNVTGTQFQPDLVWIKGRNTAYDHHLFDVARTLGNKLSSNLAAAESASGLTGYLSNGFSLSGAYSGVNGSGATFVDWLWKAGGAAVTNNAGSISSQVSANVDAGISIVTYTGNLSSAGTATVGHGLGQAPGLIISKSRNNAGGDSGQWVVRHKYLASANHYLRLNTTDTPVDSSANGSMSASTSAVFSTNWTSGMNSNGGTFVAYCFAEIPGFSKIFSYTGNGSADGPVVQCGFKPKYLLRKRTDAGSNWVITDGVRSPENIVNETLWADLASAEGTYDWVDFTANGFKVRESANGLNVNNGTYIGIAFADVPAKYSLAR